MSLSYENYAALLETCSFETLLTELRLEALRHHDGHYTILAFTTGFKVAFGTPDLYPASKAYAQVHEMPQYRTLNEALIGALLSCKTFDEYFDGDMHAWMTAFIQVDPQKGIDV